MSAGDVLVSLVLALPLWVAGTVVFDGVHWILHRMLRSRWRLLRALAWPHAVHHRWLDRDLRVCPEHQLGNVFCHLVPEYLTQLAFSVALLPLLPVGPVVACAGLQTVAFIYVVSQRGLDINHRPVRILDAYRPSFACPPAYHALHHVHPDAYFSAYTKLVDLLVGGGASLPGRRFAIAGAGSRLADALRAELERGGASEIREIDAPGEAARGDLDILILCDPEVSEVPFVEAFVAATRTRQLPPEVWVVHERPDDATARHYLRDVRVSYRTLVVPAAAGLDAASARRTARTLLSGVRRGLHFVPGRLDVATGRAMIRFWRTRPERPAGAPVVRRRAALAAGGSALGAAHETP